MRRERRRRGWTQEEVARQIGCGSKTVGRWERGKAAPGLYYGQKLIKIYGKKAEEWGLLEGAAVLNSNTMANTEQEVKDEAKKQPPLRRLLKPPERLQIQARKHPAA